MGLRPANAFGGAQLPRIADDKLLELCLGTLPDDPFFNEIVETLGRLKSGGVLSRGERDKWTHMAQKAGLLKRTHSTRPRESMAHDADRFSTVPTDGTAKAASLLSTMAKPGGQMPVPPGRRIA